MKKLILFVLIICSTYIFGQKNNIDGIYFTKYKGEYIEIKKDVFIYVTLQNTIYINDTLAKCKINRISNDFIEINSDMPAYIARKSTEIIQSMDTTVKDSIKVIFSIPYEWKLDIEIINKHNFKKYFLMYPNAKEIMLPQDIKVISFLLEPYHKNMTSLEGFDYGIRHYYSLEYNIKESINKIEIKIPAIDNGFFERNYVKGEYVRVLNNTLIWRGTVFKKK